MVGQVQSTKNDKKLRSMLMKKNHFTLSATSVYGYLFFGGILSNVVLPSFLFGIVWHPALIVSLVISLFLVFDCARAREFKIESWVWLPLVLLVVIMASDFYGKFFLGVKGDNSPLLNGMLLVLMFFPYFLAIGRIERVSGERVFFKVVNVFFVIFFTISVFQVVAVGSISEVLIKAYSHEPHTSVALAGLRYTLTGPDPNVGSSIAALFIITYFVAFMKFSSFRYLSLFALSLIPLFFAQGRTVMIGLAIVFLIYFCFFLKIKLIHKIFTFLFLVLLITISTNVLDVDYLVHGVEELSRGESGSVNVRLQKAVIVLNSFVDSPVLGQGANLEQYGTVKDIDSEYLLLLQRHGIVGASLVLGVILYLGSTSLVRLRNGWEAHIATLLCGLAVFAMLTNIFVFNVNTFGFLVLIIYFSVKSKPTSESAVS